VIRRVLANTLSADPAIEVVGTAPNGRIALEKIPQAAPDVVTLDVEMPEMDGLQTLAALRKTHRSLPVIMFSVFTKSGATATLDALAFNAVDYVTKPPAGAGTDVALKIIRDELIPKIKMHLTTTVGAATRPAHLAPWPSACPDLPTHATSNRPARCVDVVVIGLSTGGPDALGSLLPSFPKDFPVPILIVQHMPPGFTKPLANRLASKSRISVAEAHDNPVLEPGHAWLAPGGSHMIVERVDGEARLKTYQAPPENSCRPSVDILFRSAAEVFGSHVLAVVMTGMGQDGLRGCERIHQAGGQILVQDEASSVVWGMPRLVAAAGLVDQELSLPELGPEILRRVMDFRHGANQTSSKPSSGSPLENDDQRS
jgi:two-component system, chemotaxis family, protein-glutamate methylesterase/glutaminase